jgi:hypothetical protein
VAGDIDAATDATDAATDATDAATDATDRRATAIAQPLKSPPTSCRSRQRARARGEWVGATPCTLVASR